jgi:hypothetical protein
MTLSRKFYKAVAARYARLRPAYTDSGEVYQMWESMVMTTVNAISEGNPSFDVPRFLEACDHRPGEWWERHRQWAQAAELSRR